MPELSLDSVTLLAVKSAEILEKTLDSLEGQISTETASQHRKLYDEVSRIVRQVQVTNLDSTAGLLKQALYTTLKKYQEPRTASSEVMLADWRTIRYLYSILRKVVKFIEGSVPTTLHLIEFLKPYIVVGCESLDMSDSVVVPIYLVRDRESCSAKETELVTGILCINLRLLAYRVYESGGIEVRNIIQLAGTPFSKEELNRSLLALKEMYPDDESLNILSQNIDSDSATALNWFLKETCFTLKRVLEHPNPIHLNSHNNSLVTYVKRDNFWLNLVLSGDINIGVLLKLPASIGALVDVITAYSSSCHRTDISSFREKVLDEPQVENMLQGVFDTVSNDDMKDYLEKSLLNQTNTLPSSTVPSKLSLFSVDEHFLEETQLLVNSLRRTLPRLSLNTRSIRYAIKKESTFTREC